MYLEGHIAFAIPGEDDDVTVHCSTQHPSEAQHMVAHVLGVPSNAVTVNVRRMGGGFGGKESQMKTNTVSNTAFRGFGGPQGVVVAERMIEEVAYATGRDPLDVRKVNF